ncbi:hypothetical protein Ahy_B01g052294 [Arachis hypogaea]|uniref:GRF-type domain-containing protein n=1 Tax=Arachis hypogaea TaxID=3818 RepID=A0A445AP09_ARAHY|nr:hypothetical protein Ahy_B01g052294 [Arachis hypogaea]
MKVENADKCTHERRKLPNVTINRDIRGTKLTKPYSGVDSISNSSSVALPGVTWLGGPLMWIAELCDRYNVSSTPKFPKFKPCSIPNKNPNPRFTKIFEIIVMSRRRLFTPASTGSGSVSGSSISERVHDRKFNGRCFCGLGVTLLQSGTAMNPGRWFVRCPNWKNSDCNFFAWVDEIEGQWEGLRRALSEKKMQEDANDANAELKMLMMLGRCEDEVSKVRFWLVIMSMVVVCNVVCTLYLILRGF